MRVENKTNPISCNLPGLQHPGQCGRALVNWNFCHGEDLFTHQDPASCEVFLEPLPPPRPT